MVWYGFLAVLRIGHSSDGTWQILPPLESTTLLQTRAITCFPTEYVKIARFAEISFRDGQLVSSPISVFHTENGGTPTELSTEGKTA